MGLTIHSLRILPSNPFRVHHSPRPVQQSQLLAKMSSFAQVLDTLQRAYSKQGAEDTLNTAMRKALRQHAAAERLEFRVRSQMSRWENRSLANLVQQDSVGNVYISKQGRDSDLGGIALAFPLDEHESPQLFVGAFTAFSQLASQDILCGLTLMGCTSSKEGHIGLEMWAASTGASSKPTSSSLQLSLLEAVLQPSKPIGFHLLRRIPGFRHRFRSIEAGW